MENNENVLIKALIIQKFALEKEKLNASSGYRTSNIWHMDC